MATTIIITTTKTICPPWPELKARDSVCCSASSICSCRRRLWHKKLNIWCCLLASTIHWAKQLRTTTTTTVTNQINLIVRRVDRGSSQNKIFLSSCSSSLSLLPPFSLQTQRQQVVAAEMRLPLYGSLSPTPPPSPPKPSPATLSTSLYFSDAVRQTWQPEKCTLWCLCAPCTRDGRTDERRMNEWMNKQTPKIIGKPVYVRTCKKVCTRARAEQKAVNTARNGK